MIAVPRCMSTQHPDNVSTPFFAQNSVLGGEDEIQEAFYVFSHLGCEEQMWDCEGKEVDNFVIKKLLTKYEHFFRDNILGRDVFVTLRVPNPTVERDEAKILLEALDSIPRSFDMAQIFYQQEVAPIFEVILPMVSSHRSLNRVYLYYKNFVVGKQKKRLFKGDLRISDWIGQFKPDRINVIPLLEDKERLLKADQLIKQYLKGKRLDYQRVFLARSDPAENYGCLGAVVLNKIALQRLYQLEKKLGLPILPILGAGSAPFRGNLRPINVENCLNGYPSVQTFTIQSAFKYDYPEKDVEDGIDKIKKTKRGEPIPVDERRAVQIVDKSAREYSSQIRVLAPLVNQLSKHVPARRKRKLHIGLFGYARAVGELSLPRAIAFCCSLYSLGIPPEMLGLSAVSARDIKFIQEVYRNFHQDLSDALAFFNPDNLAHLPRTLAKKLERAAGLVDFKPNQEHRELTTLIMNNLNEGGHQLADLQEHIVRAAWIRRFLG